MSVDRKRLLVRILFALVVYLLVEGVSFGGLLFLRKARGLKYSPDASTLSRQARVNLDRFLAAESNPLVKLHPDLGWTRSPRKEINSAGMRDDREYNPEPDSGVLRIATFGDSFTYGSDVPLAESWGKRIPAMNPAIELLNYGVGAYGVDQAYLRYLELGKAFHPHVVFIGYMSENIGRHVNVYRGFYTGNYPDWFLTKPRFRLEKGALVLLPNPLRSADDYRRLRDSEKTVLREIGRNDFHYTGHYGAGPLDFSPTVRLIKMVRARIELKRQNPIMLPDGRYNQQSEAYALTVGILDTFYRKVLEDGALPIFVVFPDLEDQQRSRDGKQRRYAALLNDFNRKGYRYIDALQALEPVQQKYTINDLSVKWGHYSRLGNDLVAQHILQTLRRWNLDKASEVKAATVNERRRVLR